MEPPAAGASSERDRVFVYGTLRTGERNHHLVERFVRGARPARLAGHALWTCDAYPGARRHAGGVVEGELLEVERPAEALVVLDALEEVPTLYERVRATVEAGDGPVEAWTYLLALRDLSGWRFVGPRWPPR
jgi:gamma-glutamylcyclotransferase (GGCT)/AIG2-like uncharacterized protein YtfP